MPTSIAHDIINAVFGERTHWSLKTCPSVQLLPFSARWQWLQTRTRTRGAYAPVDISARTSADRQYLFIYEFTVQEFPFFQIYSFQFQCNCDFVVSLEGYKLIVRHGSVKGLSVEIIASVRKCQISLWRHIVLSHYADTRTSSKTPL